MNYTPDNVSSQELSMDELVNLNGQALEEMERIPYQPILYAVPKEWVESGKNLLQQAVQFQPTLYKKITPLATQKEVQNQQIQRTHILMDGAIFGHDEDVLAFQCSAGGQRVGDLDGHGWASLSLVLYILNKV